LSKPANPNSLIATFLAGVLFLVPLGIAGIVLVKIIGVMMLVAQPMADWLPVDSLGGVALANLIALLFLVLTCFLAGLVARHALASELVRRVESGFLMNLPGYPMIKSFFGGFDDSQAAGLKPVLVMSGVAERLGLEVERLQDGRSMIFLPSPPNPFSGITQLMPTEQVRYLDISVKDVMEMTENFGHGAERLLDSRPDKAP
jgi:uncharacterized membrane protein